MTQAKRKKQKAPKTAGLRQSSQGFGILIVGIMIGSLATVLIQGVVNNDKGVGAGIRKMMDQSKHSERDKAENNPNQIEAHPAPQQTIFDFYTVLPEIEMVVREDDPPPQPKQKKVTSNSDSNNTVKAEEKPAVKRKSSYMLQVGSYQKRQDAEKQRALLALQGLTTHIQKVTIQGRGDFFRVRLGPFVDYADMVEVDNMLARHHIQTLRLKISKG